MNLIGKGYYYNVYDIGNGRVRKIEKGIVQKVRDAYYAEDKNIGLWLSATSKMIFGRRKILATYAHLHKNADLSILGSPIFLTGINYEQDKVTILDQTLKNISVLEAKKVIDASIANILECWQNGFSDRVYNFTINNGLDAKDKMILLDFNEITFSKEEVVKRIESKRWLKAWSYASLNPELQEYYREKMDLKMTPKELDANWPKITY